MIYNEVCGDTLSMLGFGTMRLPLLENGSIDEAQVQQMVDYAMENGVNYFDTAYPYHEGESERVIGRALKKYPRDSFRLATKYPGHQVASSYNPAEIFEKQLEKCGVEYFDYYLLHNVYENSLPVYMDEQWGILDYFKKQKELGRIRHLGFSSHGSVEVLEKFLDYCGGAMEFCQLQLNYLDWTLQNGAEKYELLCRRGVPVWVMEPLRGGKLAKLPEEQMQTLQALRAEETAAGWAFRFLQGWGNIEMILSGMSNFEQMQQNVATFDNYEPLADYEKDLLLDIAETMKDSVPCTACRYCTKGCPMGLDIPLMLEIYNELRMAPNVNASMRLDLMPAEKQPSACIACGACSGICPQKLEIPKLLADLSERMKQLPSWLEISRQREEAAKRNG